MNGLPTAGAFVAALHEAPCQAELPAQDTDAGSPTAPDAPPGSHS